MGCAGGLSGGAGEALGPREWVSCEDRSQSESQVVWARKQDGPRRRPRAERKAGAARLCSHGGEAMVPERRGRGADFHEGEAEQQAQLAAETRSDTGRDSWRGPREEMPEAGMGWGPLRLMLAGRRWGTWCSPDLRPQLGPDASRHMPVLGCIFLRRKSENLSVKSPHFPLFGKPRTGTGIVPVCCLLWAPRPAPPAPAAEPPPWRAAAQPSGWAVATGIAGAEAVWPRSPQAQLEAGAQGGDLHNKDNLVPKLSLK